MSYRTDPRDVERTSRALATAKLIFPAKFEGKFFRDAAKRLSRCTGISYDDALKRLHSGALGVAMAVAEEKIAEGEVRG